MSSRIILKFILFCLIGSISCSKNSRPSSGGSYNTLYIFADKDTRTITENVINSAFIKYIKTPEEEQVYFLEWVNFDSLENYKFKRNLIFLADFSITGDVSKWVVQALELSTRKAVLDGKEWLFVKKNLFAKDQLVLFLIAPTSKELALNIVMNSDMLYQIVDQSVNERVSDFLYSTGIFGKENIKARRKLEQDWGFSMRIPQFYDLEKWDTNFVWFRALKPERWVFVYFEKTADSTISMEYWLEKRNLVGKRYYEGDIILDTTISIERAELDGLSALKFSGLWFNKEEFVGGPFLSYIFYDPEMKRKYIIDGAIFAPIVRKEPYIRHLEIIIKTFSRLRK